MATVAANVALLRMRHWWPPLLAAALLTCHADDAVSPRGMVQEFGERQFFEGLRDGSVLVEFYAPWCELCTNYQKEFEKVAAAYEGLPPPDDTQAPLLIGRVDVERHKEIARVFSVHNVPYIAFLRHERWYSEEGGEMLVHPPPRYEGYLVAAPTIAWLNSLTGLSAAWQPYVLDLDPAAFDGIALDPRRDVLVEFYTEWCPRCQEFAKFYHEVGAAFADESERVCVARVDIEKNREVALRYVVQGVPDLLLFPRRGRLAAKGPLRFRGAQRTPSAIITFVRNPQVYLVEAEVLEELASGATGGPDGDAAADDPMLSDESGDAVHRAFRRAHALATERRWEAALRELLRIQHTPSLRNTALGSSPSMWNLLDNVKFHIEQAGGHGDEDVDALSRDEERGRCHLPQGASIGACSLVLDEADREQSQRPGDPLFDFEIV